MAQKANRLWLIPTILIFVLLNTACGGIQISPGEIQFFSGDNPVSSPTPTQTPIPTPPPTAAPVPAATPVPSQDVVQAASVSGPTPIAPAAPPIANVQSVAIAGFVDSNTVDVVVNGYEYRLPYATLSPPPTHLNNIPVEWDSRLSGLGVTLTRANAGYGQPVYRLVNARYQDEVESGGLHHIYVEVLDENGQRIPGQPVTQLWATGRATGFTENKPFPEYAVNFPMYGAQGPDNYVVFIPDAASDVVNGLGLPASHLVSYLLTFQRQ